MLRSFLELQTKSDTPQAYLALRECARRCGEAAETAGLYVDFIDERCASATGEWTFLVIMLIGDGSHASIAQALAAQDASSLCLLSATLFHESDSATLAIDPSELTISYYRLNLANSKMICHTNCNVELTHQATGIVVRSQCERSRARNYQHAIALLRCRLDAHLRHR